MPVPFDKDEWWIFVMNQKIDKSHYNDIATIHLHLIITVERYIWKDIAEEIAKEKIQNLSKPDTEI